MLLKPPSALVLALALAPVHAGCDADQACTTIAIPAVRVTVACDKLPELGAFEIMSKRITDDALKPCIGPIPLSCDEVGGKVVVACGPYSDPGQALRDADYVVTLTQGDFSLEFTTSVKADECHPKTVSIALP